MSSGGGILASNLSNTGQKGPKMKGDGSGKILSGSIAAGSGGYSAGIRSARISPKAPRNRI
jgi:hypothetical protein